MSLHITILEAYTQEPRWVKFYNLISDLFVEPKALIIQAKTYSLINTCLEFREATGASHETIYQSLKEFSLKIDWLIFSSDLKLETFEDYLKSTHAISVKIKSLHGSRETERKKS
jgi:hypothetical protein